MTNYINSFRCICHKWYRLFIVKQSKLIITYREQWHKVVKLASSFCFVKRDRDVTANGQYNCRVSGSAQYEPIRSIREREASPQTRLMTLEQRTEASLGISFKSRDPYTLTKHLANYSTGATVIRLRRSTTKAVRHKQIASDDKYRYVSTASGNLSVSARRSVTRLNPNNLKIRQFLLRYSSAIFGCEDNRGHPEKFRRTR